MDTLSDRVIDALGGTTAVARMTHSPVSTVHSWRKIGIPPSRLAHLRLAARNEGLSEKLNAVLGEPADQASAA